MSSSLRPLRSSGWEVPKTKAIASTVTLSAHPCLTNGAREEEETPWQHLKPLLLTLRTESRLRAAGYKWGQERAWT